MRVYTKLNFLKGIACISVVFIHVVFPGWVGQIILNASAYAPLAFFMISGFFAYGKDSYIIAKRLRKIIVIFFISYLLFFVFHFSISIIKGDYISWLKINFNSLTIIKYVVFCTIEFATPLWYFIAMIETYLVWLVIIKYNKQILAFKLLPVLFVVMVLHTSFCETMGYDWFWKINFLTRALPWFLLGIYLKSDYAIRIRQLSCNTLIWMAVMGCFIAISPVLFEFNLKFSIIGYIPYAIALFVLAVKNPMQSVCRPIEFVGDKLSLYVYILHPLINGVFGFLLDKLLDVNSKTDGMFDWFRPIIVVLLTLLIAYCLNFVKELYERHRTDSKR